MHIRLSCFVVLALMAASAHAQDEKVIANLKADVQKMLDATLKGDAETLFSMTHPKAIEMMGGTDKAKELLKLSLDSLKATGLATKLQEIGTPTLANNKADSFAVVPYTITFTGGGKKITFKTAVVGFSADSGKSWKFLNITEKGEEEMRQLVPDLPRELKIPKQEQKVEEVK
jgi:hypothetical protein